MPQWPGTQRGTGRLDEGFQLPFGAPVPEIEVGPGRYSGSGGLLSEGAPNWQQGLGVVTNSGNTPSQPPRPEPRPARTDVSGRINELLQGLAAPVPEGPQMTPGQYQLAGMSDAVTPLAATRNRRVGIGELLGALGGGLTKGTLAGQQAGRDDRATQFNELTNMSKLQTYQRGEAASAAKIQAAQNLARELRKSNDPRLHQLAQGLELDPTTLDDVMKAIAAQAYSTKNTGYKLLPGQTQYDQNNQPVASVAPNPPAPQQPKTVTTAEGVFVLNPDGTLGPRLGASETAPDSELTAPVTPERAREMGLPEPPATSPFSNPNLSPRGRSNLVAAERARWEKRATANAETVKSANSLTTDMERFKFLNEKVNSTGVDTGGFGGSPGVAAVRGLWNEELKEMQAITARITPTLRQPGSGATSDFDVKMFQEGTVGVGKPKSVNDNIANATIAAGKNLIAKAQFEQAYFDAYQHTGGMEAAWQKYLNANPIFNPDPAKAGSFEMNQNRVDWQTFFRNGGKVPEKAPDPPDDPLGIRGKK